MSTPHVTPSSCVNKRKCPAEVRYRLHTQNEYTEKGFIFFYTIYKSTKCVTRLSCLKMRTYPGLKSSRFMISHNKFSSNTALEKGFPNFCITIHLVYTSKHISIYLSICLHTIFYTRIVTWNDDLEPLVSPSGFQ